MDMDELRAAVIGDRRVIDVFRQWDENQDGSISKEEFVHALGELGSQKFGDGNGVEFSEETIDEMFNLLDVDGSGDVSYAEMYKGFRRGAGPHKHETAHQSSAGGARAADGKEHHHKELHYHHHLGGEKGEKDGSFLQSSLIKKSDELQAALDAANARIAELEPLEARLEHARASRTRGDEKLEAMLERARAEPATPEQGAARPGRGQPPPRRRHEEGAFPPPPWIGVRPSTQAGQSRSARGPAAAPGTGHGHATGTGSASTLAQAVGKDATRIALNAAALSAMQSRRLHHEGEAQTAAFGGSGTTPRVYKGQILWMRKPVILDGIHSSDVSYMADQQGTGASSTFVGGWRNSSPPPSSGLGGGNASRSQTAIGGNRSQTTSGRPRSRSPPRGLGSSARSSPPETNTRRRSSR